MKLTVRARILRLAKQHKRQAPVHTAAALALSLGLMLILAALPSPAADAAPGDDAAIFTATMVGDIMPGRYVQKAAAAQGNYDYLFDNMRPWLEQSDYVSGNFETPVLVGRSASDDETLLFTQPQAVEALARANFSVLNLANDHMMDYGEQSLMDTIQTFAEQDMKTVGAGATEAKAASYIIQEFNGIQVASLGFSDVYPQGARAQGEKAGIAAAQVESYMEQILAAKATADLVVVNIHWGEEHQAVASDEQQRMAREMASAGADLIVGHHSNVLQPVEVFNNSIIFYGLGNFAFDQGWSETRRTVLARYHLAADGQATVELVPAWVEGGRPRPLGAGLLDRVQRQRIQRRLTSGEGSPDMEWRDGNLYFELDHSHIMGSDGK